MDGFDFYSNNPVNNDDNSDNIGRSDTAGSFAPVEGDGKEGSGQKAIGNEISAASSDNAQYSSDRSSENNEPPVNDNDNYQCSNNSNISYNDYGSNSQNNYSSSGNYSSRSSYNSNSNYNSSSYNPGSDYRDAWKNSSGNWNNDSASGGYNSHFKTPHYYTENYKKKRKGVNLWQLTAVSLISSILGGAVVGSFMLFVAPSIPALSKYLPTKTVVSNNTGTTKIEYKIAEATSQVSAIAEKASPSIVGIRVTAVSQNFIFSSVSPSEGSGIIIREDGYIITNNHVIEDALDTSTGKITDGSKIEVILPSQKDEPYIAQVIGRDARTDIAVIKINATGLPVAELGDSDSVKVGEMAVAIGNPGGLEFMGSVTVGVISGINRTVQLDSRRELKVIQTDASINPGNSGGALLNSQGQVIGINTMKAQTQLGFEGIGFAVPINEAKEVADSLISSGYVKGRPKIGVSIDTTFTEAIAEQYDVPAGLLVSSVEPFSAAFKAGIQRGDIITRFDGKQVKTFDELEEIKNSHKPGDVVPIEVYRDGKTLKLELTLGEDKSGN